MLKPMTIFTMLPMTSVAFTRWSSVKQGPQGRHTISWYLHNQKTFSQEVSWCTISTKPEKMMSCKNAKTVSRNSIIFNARKTLLSVSN
jgi:hypothetical protein